MAIEFAWHIHDEILIEVLRESIQNRINYIKWNKPKVEIALRLKLLKKVKGELPEEFVRAGQKYVETGQKYVEAGQKYVEAGQENEEACQKYEEAKQKYVEARQKYLPQIVALHKE
jgi:hypothetical protein